MNVWTRPSLRPTPLIPPPDLVTGGAAEEFEERIQGYYRAGQRHLVIDLRDVSHIDSGGVRALVRGYTTAQRLGYGFTLLAPSDPVRRVLQVTRLDSVFSIVDSLGDARVRHQPWSTIRLVVGGLLIVVSLVWGGLRWPALQTPPGPSELGAAAAGSSAPLQGRGPFVDLSKLIAAAAVGMLVTAVQRYSHRSKSHTQSIEHAQVLLCVAGSMIMIIIEGSLARAFGVAGAASIIRFRTPIEDPKDITVLFLLMTLGMATGLGAFALAGIGAAFLCLFILVLDHFGVHKPRTMMVHLKGSSEHFPIAQVESIFARNQVIFELREIAQGGARYHTTLNTPVSLDELSAQLMMGGGTGIKAVEWEPTRKTD